MGAFALQESAPRRIMVAVGPPLALVGLRGLGCDIVASTGFLQQLPVIAARAGASMAIVHADGRDEDALLQSLRAVRATLPGAELVVLLPIDVHPTLVSALSEMRAVVVDQHADAMTLQLALGVGIAAPQLLTRREIDVLTWAAQGLSNQMIARRLGLQLNTVKNYLRSVHRKLGARSRTEAVMIAARAGYAIIPVP